MAKFVDLPSEVIYHDSIISNELRTMAKEAFVIFDRNNEDKLNVRELEIALRAFGIDATDDDVVSIVNEYDPNGRGFVTCEQFTMAVANMLAKFKEGCQNLRSLLAAADSDDTGQVGREHVRKVLTEFDKTLNSEEIDEMLDEIDTAKLGKIDYDEFIAKMVRPFGSD
ncbi:neo-calmodulin-like [Daktulosphaira vitifoliae]|uniref:neo-calmodulin-like n=1 Tax=Daktulosphaira vitifoliae TaxID=58002 RepID=UPI0021A9CD45|nr:neo-calmodulin-like [Daktulosphaira vitifoliae]